jgi:hypothetical protein
MEILWEKHNKKKGCRILLLDEDIWSGREQECSRDYPAQHIDLFSMVSTPDKNSGDLSYNEGLYFPGKP